MSDENIIRTFIEDEIKTSYIDYAMSVIIGRALPDVRDGLKPVHRRILYAMNELGLSYNKDFKKCARIVGEVLGKYHPHGDTSVYDALVRMAQDFSLRYPLIQGQGNFGSIDGDPPAAMRYTEAKLAKIASLMLEDIDKETVDFIPNFDETLKEPVVLPSKLPNLLLNGAEGIAVGMATKIPPHNIVDLCNAMIAYIDNNDISIKKLCKIIKAPDFPTGGVIHGIKGVEEMYNTGRGKFLLRARLSVEKIKGNRDAIIITQLAFGTNKTSLIERIVSLVKNKKIDGISDLRDESDRDGIRIVIELKRDAIPQVIINRLYKMTTLQVTYGGILLVLVNNVPKILNLKQLIREYIEYRKEVIIKRSKYELAKAENRAHILEGLKIAIANIDEVIKIIKKSKTPAEAKGKLIKRFKLTDIQSQAILDMKLQRLTNLEVEKLEAEYFQLIKQIEYLKTLLGNEKLIYNLIKKDLKEIIKEYGDDRRTDIEEEITEFSMEDLIADNKMVVTITHNNYIKRTPISIYRIQRRGGKGIYGASAAEDDFVESLFIASNHDDILFFTKTGKVYCTKVYNLPESGRKSSGKSIVNFLNLSGEEKISSYVRVRNYEKGSLVLVTKKGLIKKCSLTNFSNVHRGGIIAMGLNEGDEIVDVKLIDKDCDILLTTKKGFAIRFKDNELREMGRTAKGVKGIVLRENDEVINLVIPQKGMSLLTVTEKGYGKRTRVEDYRRTRRGGKGVVNIKLNEKTGNVVSVLAVNDKDQIVIITKSGILIRSNIKEIRRMGRASRGVRVIKMNKNDLVADVGIIISEEKEKQEVEQD